MKEMEERHTSCKRAHRNDSAVVSGWHAVGVAVGLVCSASGGVVVGWYIAVARCLLSACYDEIALRVESHTEVLAGREGGRHGAQTPTETRSKEE